MTTSEVSPSNDDTESPYEAIGYSKPYDPSGFTPGQAHELHDNQHIGGKDMARIALRPEAPLILTPEEQYTNATRSLDRKKAEAKELQERYEAAVERGDRREIALAKKRLDANKERQQFFRDRIGNLVARIEPHDSE